MSVKSDNLKKFFKYLSDPLTLEQIDSAHVENKVVFERADLYRDFILTLNNLIIETYLGDDVTVGNEQINHFDWCWDKTCVLLNQENIFFTSNMTIYKYLLNFYYDSYYSIPNKPKEEKGIENIEKVWGRIFDYNAKKTLSELDSFLTLYKFFEKSYKKQ